MDNTQPCRCGVCQSWLDPSRAFPVKGGGHVCSSCLPCQGVYEYGPNHGTSCHNGTPGPCEVFPCENCKNLTCDCYSKSINHGRDTWCEDCLAGSVRTCHECGDDVEEEKGQENEIGEFICEDCLEYKDGGRKEGDDESVATRSSPIEGMVPPDRMSVPQSYPHYKGYRG